MANVAKIVAKIDTKQAEGGLKGLVSGMGGVKKAALARGVR